MPTTARERLVEAAFALFDERGFDRTTVDEVAERAGVGRSTFFRHFPTKEDAVLTDHAALLAAVEERLAGDREDDLAERVVDAARLVLGHYLAEGDRARRRDRLAASIPAVKAREAAARRSYQRAFTAAVERGLGDGPEATLRAELVANAVVTATNHVLRRWLRAETTTPEADLEAALHTALDPWFPGLGTTASAPSALSDTVSRAEAILTELLPLLRDLPRG